MAKPLILLHAGETVTLPVQRIDRAKLYGTRKRVALDAAGRPCTRAALTMDGQLLGAGMVAQGYFSPQGDWIPRQQMVGIAPDGSIVENQPSTLGEPTEVQGPVDPAELLELNLESIYWLSAEGESTLLTRIREGAVFRAPFNYTASLTSETAYLVANDEGIFALVGTVAPPAWIEAEQQFVPEETEEDADDLDFEDL